MIKIRGYRVEILHVEAMMLKLDEIEQAIVFEKKEANYNNYLLAIIKLNRVISEVKIREKISKELPNYMVPKKIIIFLKQKYANKK